MITPGRPAARTAGSCGLPPRSPTFSGYHYYRALADLTKWPGAGCMLFSRAGAAGLPSGWPILLSVHPAAAPCWCVPWQHCTPLPPRRRREGVDGGHGGPHEHAVRERQGLWRSDSVPSWAFHGVLGPLRGASTQGRRSRDPPGSLGGPAGGCWPRAPVWSWPAAGPPQCLGG